MKPSTTSEISSTLKCTSEFLKSGCECQCHIKDINFYTAHEHVCSTLLSLFYTIAQMKTQL